MNRDEKLRKLRKLADVKTTVESKLSDVLNQVITAMQFMIENDIMPVEEHQEIALLWAKNKISDADFLLMARNISERVANES